ncbi:MAG TPA: hypothetical protein VGJ00_01905 [Rhabdochlamydiaceae bacterium]|jgi:hypothetical protein
MTESSFTIETVKGEGTAPYLPNLIELRLSFFRNYPYFYEGNVTDEENYVHAYARSEHSLLAIAKTGQEVIGVVAGLPLLESLNENKKLFTHEEISAENAFYIGEIVISGKNRNSNMEQKLYQEFEKSIRDLKKYNTLLVCEIERKDSKKQENPFSAETSWEERGFVKQPELSVQYSWQEIGAPTKTDHLMIFWQKKLS